MFWHYLIDPKPYVPSSTIVLQIDTKKDMSNSWWTSFHQFLPLPRQSICNQQKCIYIRILLPQVSGPKCFDDLKKFDGHVCSTYLEAHFKHGLVCCVNAHVWAQWPVYLWMKYREPFWRLQKSWTTNDSLIWRIYKPNACWYQRWVVLRDGNVKLMACPKSAEGVQILFQQV